VNKVVLLFLSLLVIAVVPVLALREIRSETIPGQIAYVGTDYNIYTYSFLTDSAVAITTDATDTRRYQWPTWSVDSRLAYFCCDLQLASSPITSAFVSPDGRLPGVEVRQGIAEQIIYAYWAPDTCDAAQTCMELGMLVNDVLNGTLWVEVYRDHSNSRSQRLDQGSPFYYSWSSTAGQFVFHRNSSQLAVYDTDLERESNLAIESSGNYQAPAWSPIDTRILVGARGSEDNTTNLVITTADTTETAELVTGLSGFVSFAWSPNAQYVAYRTLSDELGEVSVVNSGSGEIIWQSSLGGVLGFFWAPDSKKLALLTIQAIERRIDSDQDEPLYIQNPTQTGLSWAIVDIESGETSQYDAFLPSRDMLYLITYFDQFSQSHRIWSPDSTHLVYSHLNIDSPEQPLISILNVADPLQQPQVIAEGGFAVWSFGD